MSIKRGILLLEFLVIKLPSEVRKLLLNVRVDSIKANYLFNSDYNLVTLTVFLLQMTRRAIAHKFTIDHDDYGITECFSFVHSVSGEHYGRLLEVLKHFEEGSPCNGIHSSSGLVQKFNFGISHE